MPAALSSDARQRYEAHMRERRAAGFTRARRGFATQLSRELFITGQHDRVAKRGKARNLS